MISPLKAAAFLLLISAAADVYASPKSALTPDQRLVHALDRLSFGPRPGELEKVKALGVDKWINQQLRPNSINDQALETRLAQYPAMQLSLQQRIEMFPANPVIRGVQNGRIPEPQNGFEHAIYADQLERLDMRQQAKAAKQRDGQTSSETAAATDNGSPSIVAQEDRLYGDLDALKVINLPASQRFNQLVAMTPAAFASLSRSLNGQERQRLVDGLTPQQTEIVVALENPAAMIGGEAMTTRLLRDVYSERELQAVMTDFWLNHFNIYIRKGPFEPWYLADYQNNVILPHAMGHFEDLLDAVAKSPAMLDYLDNASSIGPHSPAAVRAEATANRSKPLPGLNENYSRELMELHTLGVNGGYTQNDVVEVAKVFTGWTVEKPAQGGGFAFMPQRHEPGTKIVLGRKINEAGGDEGLEVLHILATSHSTAHFISLELAQRFVSDNPSPKLVNRMAATYLKTHGQISEVLRTMFHSPEFWSQASYRSKVKTPEEFVVSAVRATGGDVVNSTILVGALNKLGMPLYGCQTPNGYSWQADAWVNTGDLVNRMNFALSLANNRAGTAMDYNQLIGAQPLSDQEIETSLEAKLLGDQLSEQTHGALLKQLSTDIAPMQATQVSFAQQRQGMAQPDRGNQLQPPANLRAAVITGLLLGSPDFQRR